jgi:REP element-mobilizing transposase RayT
MGRNPRIEFEGAVYHVMCRGNRQEAVFRDEHDCRMFLNSLEEVCSRTGWRIHAYVLMGNHYHLLLETPHAHLVDGMRWLQGTYTKRFNIRHKQWGHLFQSRYKALLVDPGGDYFLTVSSYIHLNPARANCFDLKKGKLSDYLWSSYPLYLRPAKRPEWLAVERTLGNRGLSDDTPGRTKYRQYLQERVLEIACSENPHEVDERWAEIRRGWCFGSAEFRDRMVESLDGVMKGRRRDSYVGDETRKHDTLEAERLLSEGLNLFKLHLSDLPGLRKNDPRKKVIAWHIRKNTSVKNEWIARQVRMGCVSNMSQYVREVDEDSEGELCALRKKLK